MVSKYDTIIVGAGAAGLMCAYIASTTGKKVLILDHSSKLAEKIRISGGGRCNFTNLNTMPNCYISNNPFFCISPLSLYTPNHFTELLDKYNIPYHEKKLGQLFCNNSSQDIINLLDMLNKQGMVTRKMSITINHIEKTSSGFILHTPCSQFISETVVIATGGLSVPQIGATGFGYNIAKQFSIPVIPPKPALVPFTLAPEDIANFAELSGTSFFSKVNLDKISFEENTLLTHRGLSGPAILQISSYWESRYNITINFLPNHNIINVLQQNQRSNKLLANFLQQFFSSRLAQNLCNLLQLNKPISSLSKPEVMLIGNLIHKFTIKPNGTQGHKKAEVTKGGVDTKFLSSKSMQSTTVAGLFFIGEVVDVTGHLGGYNFQWAWASAYACGRNL